MNRHMRKLCGSIVIIAAALTTAGSAQSGIRAVVFASGFTLPLAIVQDPRDASVQFVVEQGGRIRTVQNQTVLAADLLNLTGSISSGGERGLLGMAFPPDDATTGRFYVNFTNTAGDTVVARFTRSGNPLVADSASRFDLRWNGTANPAVIAQPFANHNGGHLAFGPDGFLYVGMGDGGSADDPGNRAQNGSELLGKMLRVDISVPDADPIGYRIPPDNPFVAGGPAMGRGEIWAFGLRNPWRFTFDAPERGGSGAMLIGDVGQNAWEEVDYEPPGRGGRNYGWRLREGAHDRITSTPPAYRPLIEPIEEYSHSLGQSITGGYVYRGTALPERYRGRYFFADFVQGRVWSVALSIGANGEATASDRIEHTSELSSTGALGNISSFGTDARGELFIVGHSRGVVLRVTSATPPAPSGLRIVPP
jgi:glucose/arabinose dehydrogenase